MQTKVFGLGLGLGLVALAWAGVDLRPPAQAPGGVADVVYLATVASWLTLVWLLVGAAVTALGRLRGRPGRWADAVASRITPPAVRRAVHLALGAALTVGPVAGGGPAFAGGVGGRWGPGPQPTQPNLDWPAGAPAGPAAPPVAASAAPTAPAARPPAGRWWWWPRVTLCGRSPPPRSARPPPTPRSQPVGRGGTR